MKVIVMMFMVTALYGCGATPTIQPRAYLPPIPASLTSADLPEHLSTIKVQKRE